MLAKICITLTYFFENNVNILVTTLEKKSVTVYVNSHVYEFYSQNTIIL